MSAIVLDNHRYVAESVKVHLESASRPQVSVEEVFTQPDPVAQYVRHNDLDLCVLDVDLGQSTGFSVIREISEDVQTVVLTRRAEVSYFARAWDAGATGYALKTHSRQRFLHTTRKAIAGTRDAPQHMMAKYAEYVRSEDLTQKQREWARHFVERRSPKDIADQMSVAKNTVYQRKMRVKQKLGCEDDRRLYNVLKTRLEEE